MRETEVVIAGAGPTGLMLACELALAGVETLVVERLPRRIEQTKGGAIQPRTAELLELRGLLEPIERRTLAREPVGGHFALLPVQLDCTPWDTRHPHPIAIPQWEVEEVLEERATSLGAAVVRDAPVTAVEQGDGVVVTAGDQRIRARYLVACDGGHSTRGARRARSSTPTTPSVTPRAPRSCTTRRRSGSSRARGSTRTSGRCATSSWT